jgi:hypothetical protein
MTTAMTRSLGLEEHIPHAARAQEPFEPVPSPHCPFVIQEVANMTLDAFANAGLVLKVFSRLLNDTVILASDNAILDIADIPDIPDIPAGNRGTVVYRAAELQAIKSMRPKELRQLHSRKQEPRGDDTGVA